MVGVAPLGFVEHAGDDLGGVRDDARGQPLVPGGRGCGRLGAFGVCSGQDVFAGARRRGQVVDGADLGDPLPVPLFALREPAFELLLGGGGLPGGRGAERVGAHHDPFPVAGEHQDVAGVEGGAFPVGVELLDVGGGRGGELLDLPLPEPLPGRPRDRVGRVVRGAARRLDRREPPQPVRVLLRRQVQKPVGGIQVLAPARPVGEPLDPDLAEHRRKRPPVTALDAPARHTVGIDDPVEPRLPARVQIEVILEQLPHQLTAVPVKTRLQLSVIQRPALLTPEEPHERVEPLLRPGKPARTRVLTCQAPDLTRPVEQDFISPQITSATGKGVKVGGHQATSHGRR